MIHKLQFKNLNLGSKYSLAVWATILLFFISITIINFSLVSAKVNLKKLNQVGGTSINLNHMTSLFQEKEIQISNYIILQKVSLKDEFINSGDKFNDLLKKTKPVMQTAQQKKIYQKITQNNSEMNDLFLNQIVPAIDKGQKDKVSKLMNQVDRLRWKTSGQLDKLQATIESKTENAALNTEHTITKTMIILPIAEFVSILLSILVMLWINRKVKKGFNGAIRTANEISEGNLDVQDFAYDGNDELGRLTSAIHTMRDNLRTMVRQISDASGEMSKNSGELSHSAGEISVASQQMAVTMQQLASGSENQAESTSGAADLITNFMEKVDSESKNSESMSLLSEEIMKITEQGSSRINSSISQIDVIYRLVKDAVEKVQGLDKRSQEISKLVLVIKEISEQTNLLALNAAIEAARAGEHGRGFGVVAEEVRKLAEEVADSVKEITEIVQGIQHESKVVSTSLENGYTEVEKGTKQMKDTGTGFETIQHRITGMVEQIKTMSENLSEVNHNGRELMQSVENIAAISQQSSAGIEQTSASVQQSSSSMEEIKARSDSLAELAEKLNGVVKEFKL